MFFCKVMRENHSWKWLWRYAPSKFVCLRTLLQEKYYVYGLFSLREFLKKLRYRRSTPPVSQAQWALFFERLHAQLAIGNPLLLSLKQVAHDRWPIPIRQFTTQAIERLTDGYFITPLLQLKHLNFSPQQIGILQCAESGGYFVQGLERLKDMLQFHLNIKKKMQQNLIYPACVLLFAFFFGCVLSFFLLPRFEMFIREQQLTLNRFTQIIFQLNHYALPCFLCGLVVFIISIIVLKAKHISPWTYMETLMGRTCSAWKYSLFAMDLSHLLGNQMPLIESLKLAAPHLPKKIPLDTMVSALNNGSTLSEALAQLPGEFRDALHSAELQGTLPQTLLQLSQSYYQAYETQLMHYARWLEPISLILIAVGLFITILGLFYPLLHVFQALHLEE